MSTTIGPIKMRAMSAMKEKEQEDFFIDVPYPDYSLHDAQQERIQRITEHRENPVARLAYITRNFFKHDLQLGEQCGPIYFHNRTLIKPTQILFVENYNSYDTPYAMPIFCLKNKVKVNPNDNKFDAINITIKYSDTDDFCGKVEQVLEDFKKELEVNIQCSNLTYILKKGKQNWVFIAALTYVSNVVTAQYYNERFGKMHHSQFIKECWNYCE